MKTTSLVTRSLFLLLNTALSQIHYDTIGWTTRDRQFLGPALRYIYNDPQRGVHAIYKDGYGAIRYNFKPRDGDWQSDSGFLVNHYQRNLGCMDVDITSGQAIISSDYLSRGKRVSSYFRDSVCGAGVFQETDVLAGLQYNLVACARYGYPRFAAIRNDSLIYNGLWSGRNLGPIGPFPLHNIIASKISPRLGFIWTEYHSKKLYFRETPDGGGTWYATRSLSDSVPSNFNRALFGASGVYDSIQPHLVIDFFDGTDRGKVQLWHYCQYQTPAWSFITQFEFLDTTKLGRHTAGIDRASIGITRYGTGSDSNRLYVIWEQFEPDNIDPATGIARADIWASFSPDNGRSWCPRIRLTQPDQTSKRFPYLAEVVNDTLHIIYFADQCAGTWELGEGEMTENPVVYLKVPVEIFSTGIIEAPEVSRMNFNLPTVVSRQNLYRILSPIPDVRLFDSLGRSYQIERGSDLLPGVYFVQTATPPHIFRVVVLP